MPIGILGRKKGMTQVFMETGQVVPVTILECPNNLIKQIKTSEKEGYNAVCLGPFTHTFYVI